MKTCCFTAVPYLSSKPVSLPFNDSLNQDYFTSHQRGCGVSCCCFPDELGTNRSLLERTQRNRIRIMACLCVGRFKDTLNGSIQHGIELSIGLLGRQPFYQRPRKARHDAVIPAEPLVGFFPRVTAR